MIKSFLQANYAALKPESSDYPQPRAAQRKRSKILQSGAWDPEGPPAKAARKLGSQDVRKNGAFCLLVRTCRNTPQPVFSSNGNWRLIIFCPYGGQTGSVTAPTQKHGMQRGTKDVSSKFGTSWHVLKINHLWLLLAWLLKLLWLVFNNRT